MSYSGRCSVCLTPYQGEPPERCCDCGAILNVGLRIDATPDYVKQPGDDFAPVINAPTRFTLTSTQGYTIAALSEEIWRQRRQEGVIAALDLDLTKLADCAVAAVKKAQVDGALDDVRKAVNALRALPSQADGVKGTT